MRKRRALIGLLLVIAFSSASAGPAQAKPTAVGSYTGCANPANQTEIPEAECLALVALYDGTTGASWTTDTDWKATDTPCSWYGVICSGGNVYSLILSNNNLAGSIPTELGNLSNLTNLYLYTNGLTGGIPTQLGNLSNLIHLYLDQNSLTGPIPTELGNLSNLEQLYLNQNSLTGSIPSELGNLSNLQYLFLNGNNLDGSIPTALGNLSKLKKLQLSTNNLTGSIPTQMGNLSNLTHLYLYDNSMSGGIPTQLGSLSNLIRLYLYTNSLTGSIPTELGNLTNLEYLYLQSNSLSGIVPSELGNLGNLTNLQIQSNTALSGWLPSSMTNLASLDSFWFDGTSLCERPDTAFQAWLGGISLLDSTNVTCTEIFTDGFESGNFSAWDASTTGGGDLKVCTKAALNGTYGMCVKNKTNKTKFVTDSGMSETWFNAQFNFDPNGLKLQNKKKVRILQAKDGSTATHWLELRKKNGKFQVRALAMLDGSGKVKTGWQKIANKPHLMEVEWSAATGAGNNDGYLKLYIDGRLKQAKSDLDNDVFVVDVIRLGFTNSPKKFTVNGVFFIDDYQSSDDGYIGK